MPLAIPELVVLLEVILAFLVAIALRVLVVGIVWLILTLTGKVIGRIPGVGNWLQGKTLSARDDVIRWLGNVAASLSNQSARWFHGLERFTKGAVDETVAFALETYEAVKRGRAWTIHQIGRTRGEAATRTQTLDRGKTANLSRSVAAQRRWMRARVAEMHDYVNAQIAAAIAAAIPGALRVPRARLGWLERTLGGLKSLVRKHEKLLAGAGLTALALSALKRLGLGFLRCRNFTRAGKRVCGMNPDLLGSLLLDTVAVVGTLSLVEFAEDLQGITEETAGWMRWFWKVSPDKPKTQRG